MSERYGRQEGAQRKAENHRPLGPDIDIEGHRMDGTRGDGPRPVGAPREAHLGGSDDRGTSWISVVFGWLAALGAGLILSGIVGAVVGAILGAGGASSSATEGGTTGLIGLLLTLLLAFIIGGYVAGRLASRSGLKHGVLVPVLMLAVTIVLAGIGALLGLSFLDNLSGVTLPSTPNNVPQDLGTILTGAGILALLAPFIGGAIGGALGARTGRKRP